LISTNGAIRRYSSTDRSRVPGRPDRPMRDEASGSMRTTWATLASAILAISALARSPALPAQQAGHADAIARDRAQGQVLETYCFECHNSSDWAGGLALDLFSPESVPQDADAFEKVIRKLRGRTMPPPGED